MTDGAAKEAGVLVASFVAPSVINHPAARLRAPPAAKALSRRLAKLAVLPLQPSMAPRSLVRLTPLGSGGYA